jgi:hypothetical protein
MTYAVTSIENMERFARESHIAQHKVRGERYATDAEMEMHLADPLAFYELVRDDVIVATGCDLDGRTVVWADGRTMGDARDRIAKRHAYNAAAPLTPAKLKSRVIRCSWCGGVVAPKAARMRMFESDSIRVSGMWLAHFHPECGDAVLDMCEAQMAGASKNTA